MERAHRNVPIRAVVVAAVLCLLVASLYVYVTQDFPVLHVACMFAKIIAVEMDFVSMVLVSAILVLMGWIVRCHTLLM